MRINQFVAHATNLSRRSTDKAIEDGRVKINDATAIIGQLVEDNDLVTLDDEQVKLPISQTTILVNKPVGYVCSRDGQGAPTIYELIPEEFHKLKHIGRLDKESSGLVVLTDDGNLAHMLSHPKFDKIKSYSVELNKSLQTEDKQAIEKGAVLLDGKPSIMKIKLTNQQPQSLVVELHEGRNRQIRRTFNELGYEVTMLRRDVFGPYKLSQLGSNKYIVVS